MATTRRWLAVSIGLVLMWPLAGVARAENHTVLLKGLAFDPKTVEIAAGDTVVWKFENGERHSVTLDDGTEIGCRPGLLQENCLDQPGETRSHTFAQVGAFAYYCRFHGSRGGQGMSGVVKVASTVTTVAAASTSTTRPATSTTTAKPKPTTTTTARALTTSSTVIATTTTLAALPTTTLTPNEAPPFDPADPGGTTSPSGEQAASAKDEERDSSAVTLIVALLLAVAGGGGLLLWRLRPGRGTPPGPPSPPPPGP